MKNAAVKKNLFTTLLCLTLILQLAPIAAQESDDSWIDLVDWSNTQDDAKTTAPETTAPKAATGTATPETATETTAAKAAEPKAAPKSGGQTPSIKMPNIDGAKAVNTAKTTFNKIIGYIAQIGAIFGKTTGVRIGGTSGSAIVMLIVAKVLQERGPSWLKWLLYLSGGTMVAGSGANITQLIMRFL